jgi:hypothetical protein
MKAFYTHYSIALEMGDRVDGLWMGWRILLGSHLLLEDIIAGLTADYGTRPEGVYRIRMSRQVDKVGERCHVAHVASSALSHGISSPAPPLSHGASITPLTLPRYTQWQSGSRKQ